ncbi:hypothetical protein PINS_up014313 [Pythium insidiosum]|nr:hypothetical protein PINS_up014313 [Pythium insidiosum]
MMAATVASFLPRLEGDDWLQTTHDDAFTDALDAFFTAAVAVDARRDVSDDDRLRFEHDARVVFALYERLARELALNSECETPLCNIARVTMFAQVYGSRNRAAVSAVLDALVEVQAVASHFHALLRLLAKQLSDLHTAVEQRRRPQVVELIQTIYETSVSLSAWTSCNAAATRALSLDGLTDVTDSSSLLNALAVCYECDIPVLQRALATLDEKSQRRAALLIPTTRLALLECLGGLVQALMNQEIKQHETEGHAGDSLLAVLHELSHCTDAEATDHGSFVSDLWHLRGFESKIVQCLETINMDRDSVSYLEVVVDGLPRRRIVVESYNEKKRETAEPSPAPVEPPTSAQPQPELSSLIQQVQDLFPDLGDGYVALCLRASELNLETVINMLLEGNPPPSLLNVRQNLRLADRDFSALEKRVLSPDAAVAAAAATASAQSEVVDPSRIWVGKKAQEKSYNPKLARQDPALVEKTMKIADAYAQEERNREAARAAAAANAAAAAAAAAATGATPSAMLNGPTSASDVAAASSHPVYDEYDDDYNDEFEDYEPFSVHDSGQTDDQDAVREQNRLARAIEEEDAYWESMRNQNRRLVDEADDDDEEDEAKEEKPGSAGGARRAPQPNARRGGNWSARRGPANSSDGAPASAQSTQRQRNRETKNKAKIGNHHRKERALKKRG